MASGERRSPGRTPMGMLPRTDLKFRLTLRVVAAAALCCAVTSLWVLVEADRAARARIASVAALAAQDLTLQRSKHDWVSGLPSAFPDLQEIAPALMAPGLCIAYRTTSGEILQRFCAGGPPEREAAPAAFAALYRRLFDPGREAASPVRFRGETLGEAVAWLEPAAGTAEAWHEASRLLAAMAATLLLLSVVVHAALARALRPTRLIRAGLLRIAANDLSARLPPFDLAELTAVRDVFNHLAASLEQSLAERAALTRRLIALQDDERRHLARELHDEFGQCLAAIRALAASAQQTAAEDCPALLPECDGIARTTARMTESLRGALFRLRPPDVEELGLAASLEGLVAGWNGRARGRTRFEIRLEGDLDGLPAAIGAALYRVAQEALTNAAKHAGASRVALRLKMTGGREIELTVEDDGRPADPGRAGGAGLGLLGMRERVASLGGRLSFEAGGRSGAALHVAIPVAERAA